MSQDTEYKKVILKGILNILQKEGLGEMCTLSPNYYNNTLGIMVHKIGHKNKIKRNLSVPFQPITIENTTEGQVIRLCQTFSFDLANPTSIEKLIKAIKLCVKNQKCSKCREDVENQCNKI